MSSISAGRLVRAFSLVASLAFPGGLSAQAAPPSPDIADSVNLFIDALGMAAQRSVQRPCISELYDIGLKGLRDAAQSGSTKEIGQYHITQTCTDQNATIKPARIRNALEKYARNSGKDARELTYAALKAAYSALDPHSSFLSPTEQAALEDRVNGAFGGIGVRLEQDDGHMKIVETFEGSPSHAAGINAGDEIITINGQDVKGMPLDNVAGMLRGEPGTSIELTVSKDGTVRNVPLVRAVIAIPVVKSRMIDNIGYIALSSFPEQASDLIRAAIDDMKATGKLDGLILDLRNNPGGLLNQARAVSDAFIDGDVQLVYVDSTTQAPAILRSSPGDIARDLGIVVLVNSPTASAAEIVSCNLQSYGRAQIMGETTFGKGSIQTLIPAEGRNGSSFGMAKITTGIYYCGSPAPDDARGTTPQNRGVIPDVEVVDSNDPPKKAEHEADSENTIRTGNNGTTGPSRPKFRCSIPDDLPLGALRPEFLRADGKIDPMLLCALAEFAPNSEAAQIAVFQPATP